MNNIDKIAAEAAGEIAVKAHKNIPAVNAYYPEIAAAIIKAAIEKATETLRQDIRGLQEARWQEHRERESRAAHASDP